MTYSTQLKTRIGDKLVGTFTMEGLCYSHNLLAEFKDDLYLEIYEGKKMIRRCFDPTGSSYLLFDKATGRYLGLGGRMEEEQGKAKVCTLTYTLVKVESDSDFDWKIIPL